MQKKIALTFDDTVINHFATVGPLLKEYGFGGTFYITEWGEEWRNKNSAYAMTVDQIRELEQMGFEIGNHTRLHANLQKMSAEEIENEIVYIEKLFADNGISHPVTFAYPGGPYCEEAAKILKKRGYLAARTTERTAIDLVSGDPLRLPAISSQDPDDTLDMILSKLTEENPVAVVYHGVPDLVHPHCSTSLKRFIEHLETFKQNNITCVALKELFN